MELKGPMAYQRHEFFDKRRTLLDTLRRIESIADDPTAAGVVVNLSGAQIGTEMLWEIREQLAGLRARGKKVIVYVDRAGMSGYLLATVADQIWMDPAGMLDRAIWRSAHHDARPRLGLGVDEWRFFTYKSAFETYSRDSMSEPDREQRQDLVDDFYEEMAVAVTTARGLSRAAWDSLVDNQGIFLPEAAREAGLVDAIGSFETARETAGRAPVRTRPNASSAVLAGVSGDPVWSPISREHAAHRSSTPSARARWTGHRGRTLARAIKRAREDRASCGRTARRLAGRRWSAERSRRARDARDRQAQAGHRLAGAGRSLGRLLDLDVRRHHRRGAAHDHRVDRSHRRLDLEQGVREQDRFRL
jgi:protease-4